MPACFVDCVASAVRVLWQDIRKAEPPPVPPPKVRELLQEVEAMDEASANLNSSLVRSWGSGGA